MCLRTQQTIIYTVYSKDSLLDTSNMANNSKQANSSNCFNQRFKNTTLSQLTSHKIISSLSKGYHTQSAHTFFVSSKTNNFMM